MLALRNTPSWQTARVYAILTLCLLTVNGVASSKSNKSDNLFEMSIEELMNINIVTASILDDLFEMSIEELMDLNITTALKYEEMLLNTPTAITVIVQNDVCGSGYQSIPEALRAVPSIHVSKIK